MSARPEPTAPLDFRRKPIHVGDTVMYFRGGRYDSLNECIVRKIKTKVQVEILRSSRGAIDDLAWTDSDRLVIINE